MLLHDEDRNTWVNWLQRVGVRHVTRAVGPLFEDGQLTLSATQAGVGPALLRAPLIQRELAAGLFLHGAQQPAREAPGTIRQVGIGTRTEVIIVAVVQCLVRQLD